MNLFQINTLTKSFSQSRPILDRVSLAIPEGVFVTIKGPSGSGKSTLLNILAGFETEYTGSVYYRERDLKVFTEADWVNYRRFDMGYVFQFFYLFPRLTVEENILLPAKLAGRSGADVDRRAADLIATFGLEKLRKQDVNNLSGGEKQRTALARALINKPKLLFADEPTGNLDSENVKIVLNLIQRVHQEDQVTVILVTHDEDVFRVGDMRLSMKDGCLGVV